MTWRRGMPALAILALYITADEHPAPRTKPLFNHTPSCIRLTNSQLSSCIEFPNHPVQLIHHSSGSRRT